MSTSRRALLGTALKGTAAALPAASPFRLALADAATDRRLVVLVLRGAMDGLAAVPPHGDKSYRDRRGALALPGPGGADGITDLDGFFGLHPALAPLDAWYRQGEVLVLHAVATPYRDRSHFDGQDLLENGTAVAHGAADGWLNRALGLMGHPDRRLGLALGQGVPLILRGATPVASWAPSPLPEAHPDFMAMVAALYRNDPLLARALDDGLRAADMADRVIEGSTIPGDMGGEAHANLQLLAKTAGQMLAAADGPRIAVLDLPGWDTHAGQGTTKGRMAQALQALASSVDELRRGLGAAWSHTVMLTVTEFGRTASPNGTGGTDHGTATAMLLIGGAVAGGRVQARWPGLGDAALYQGRDLAPTLDVRAVLKGVLRDHLRLPPDRLEAVVLPGSHDAPPQGGLVRA